VVVVGIVVFTLAHGLVLYAVLHLGMSIVSYAHHVLHMSSPLDGIEDRYVAHSFKR